MTTSQIKELYEKYHQIIIWETETLGCKITELRHLIGRLGEFYCAIYVEGTLAQKTNQHGFDIIDKKGRTISVKTTAQKSGFVSINKATLHKVSDLMFLQLKDNQISILYYGSILDATNGLREWEGKFELDISKAKLKQSTYGYKYAGI